MSEMGHERRFPHVRDESAYRPIADMRRSSASWPFDPVVDDLACFRESVGGSCERRRCGQPQPVFVVYRHDETGLPREIEPMEMVSLGRHRFLSRCCIAAIMRALRDARGDRPKPGTILRCRRGEHDAADVALAVEHVVVVV
jgi:hypothetical protein